MKVVINCSIPRGLKYHKARPNFHQWRDNKQQVYGLNFTSLDEAETFSGAVEQALEALAALHRQQHHQSQPPPPAIINQQQQQQQQLQQQQQQQPTALQPPPQVPFRLTRIAIFSLLLLLLHVLCFGLELNALLGSCYASS